MKKHSSTWGAKEIASMGMMLAILLGNTFAPIIDHCVVGRAIARRNKAALKTA